MTQESADRLLSGQSNDSERSQELSLRPQYFDALIGQKELIANLKVFVKAAKEREDALDHILLCGPPGLGKTTLAHVIAQELQVDIHATSGPAIERKDLAGILSHLKPRDVLFIDEIHRLSPVVEENLYPAMEDFKFDLIIGQGPHARSIQMPLPRFTLIGATTRSGLLTGPMRDRFGFIGRLRYYDTSELTEVIKRSSALLKIPCDPQAPEALACRCRGTPRIANRLLKRVRDFADVEGQGRIDLSLAQMALLRLGVDPCGLDEMDRQFLKVLIEKFQGGPVGIETMAAALSEGVDTLEQVYEPYLLQEGLLQRTARGRMATVKAYEHLGLPVPAIYDRSSVPISA